MQYFTSIDNTPYFHWQVELLIESFHMQNMQDNLCIGISNPQAQGLPEFTTNLRSHSNKFFFEAYTGHPALSRIYATTLAVTNGVIKPPFVLIDCDTILLKPIKENLQADIIFHQAEEDETLKKILEPKICKLCKEYNIDRNIIGWLPVGNTILFNKLDEDILFRALQWGEQIAKEKDGLDIERAAWIMSFHDFLPKFKLGTYFYEATLMHHAVEAFLIHYDHGLPPEFVKRNFTYKNDEVRFMFAGSDPYNAILKNNPTSMTNALQKVVKCYLGREDVQMAFTKNDKNKTGTHNNKSTI